MPSWVGSAAFRDGDMEKHRGQGEAKWVKGWDGWMGREGMGGGSPVQERGQSTECCPGLLVSDSLHFCASALHVTHHPQCAAVGCRSELDPVLFQELQCPGGGGCHFPSA